jgi:hypothetical protein
MGRVPAGRCEASIIGQETMNVTLQGQIIQIPQANGENLILILTTDITAVQGIIYRNNQLQQLQLAFNIQFGAYKHQESWKEAPHIPNLVISVA